MPNVNVLSPDVIAKIAAGEVVDRPCSVVKELLENAIDARATSIEIHLKDAGKELIHIKDNGCGISKSNLEKLFTRHATSKLSEIEDLEKLGSMGFRGEALYSIAAVSDITMRTQEAHAKECFSLHLRGGKRIALEPTATSAPGTDIKVSELFFNTPARRKFLKNNNSELHQIINIVLPYTLIYPQIRFLLTHAGKAILDLKPTPDQIDRAAAALNLNEKNLLKTSQNFPQENLSIKAVLGNINVQRPRRDTQYFFINKRPVESKSLGFCMNDVYRLILAPGIYPAFILEINLDPSLVDVNIHPTKREVRIKDEAKINSIVRRLTEYTLMRFGSAKSIEAPPASYQGGIAAEQMIFAPGQWAAHSRAAQSSNYQTPSSLNIELPQLFQNTENPDNLHSKFSRARFIGAFLNKYLLFEEGTSLFCVDQHAAQERIMFEKFTNQVERGTLEVQPLLTPLSIKLNIQERINWDETQERLMEMGIETALFDEETLAIHTQPLLLKNIENSVRILLSGADVARCDKATLARRACKASIVTGDPLSPIQVEHQRRELLACLDPFTCPHGRPTVVELKESFLDRQFLRT